MNNTLTLFDPVDTLKSFAEGTIWDDPFWTAPRYRKKNVKSAADLIEYDDYYELTMDLPGVDKENIDISLEDNRVLTISAQRSDENKEKNGRTITYSNRKSNFKYSVNVGNVVKADEIEAEVNNGVLTLTMPKNEQELHRVKRIEIT